MTAYTNDVMKRKGASGGQHVFTPAQINDNDDDAIRTTTKDKAYEGLAHAPIDTLSAMINALGVMQDEFFEVWQGIWPAGIDWTSAVIGTLVSGSLGTISTSLDYFAVHQTDATFTMTEKAHENLVNRYFSQLVASYFGQDAFRMRNEGYDDMLWVVLGWLETINFVRLHANTHYKEPQRPFENEMSPHSSWYGKQWIPSFAHRARLFWDLASKGWDTTLCNGGMLWSPYETPYKNAITNELFISASVSMYLYFPGDDNPSPFRNQDDPSVGPHDPKYLAAAIEGYKWLNLSNMTNEQGLYTDGFHVKNWERHPKNDSNKNTKCDERNNMVYTYNQGVLLSGQRGLWEATGAQSYLDDGHKLISDVIAATGYDLKHDKPYEDDPKKRPGPNIGEWRGMGRLGILEDVCDAYGYCSQDGQTFKGILFHHLTLFCAPLLPQYTHSVKSFDPRKFQDLQSWHQRNCARYGGWIRHNAEAAMSTRNDNGVYGGWWGAPVGNLSQDLPTRPDLPNQAVDYRNEGIPNDRTWRGTPRSPHHATMDSAADRTSNLKVQGIMPKDPNDRGRGRTVETQGGGLAVLRALWEIVDLPTIRAQMDAS